MSRRVWIVCVAGLALAGAGVALGLGAGRLRGQGRQGPAKGGPAVFDVTRFGAAADPSADSTSAFEAAAGAAAAVVRAGGPSGVAEIYVPGAAGAYTITRPIHVADGVNLRGDGWTSKIQMYGAARHPMFVFGVDAVRATAEERPDLFGVLDASAAPARGTRRGVSTAGGRFLQLQFHDLVLGRRQPVRGQEGNDYWEQTDELTVDIGFAPLPGRPWKPNAPIAGQGVGDGLYLPTPWILHVSETTDELIFLTADERFNHEYDDGGHCWRIPLRGATPPYDLSCQVSLKHGRFTAYLNGKQVPVVPRHYGRNYAQKTFAPGHKLRRNEDRPLYVGTDGTNPAAGSKEPTPLLLTGLHVSARERYAVGRPGDPQRRADGGGAPVNDLFRYFERSKEDATVGYLPLTDLKTVWTVDVHDQTGATGSALWMRLKQGGGLPNHVKDLWFAGRGPCLVPGAVLNFNLDRVRAESSESVAVGSWRIVAAYPVTLNDCWLGGYDAAYYGFEQYVWANNTYVLQSGRDAWRFRGCDAVIRTSFYAFFTEYTERVFNFLPVEYGGVYRITDAVIDSENTGFGTAVLEAYLAPLVENQIVVDRMTVTYTRRPNGRQVPLCKLIGWEMGGEWRHPGVFEARNVTAAPDFVAVVSTDSPNWVGQVYCPQMIERPAVHYTGAEGTRSRILDVAPH